FAFFASGLHMDYMDVFIEDSFDIPTGEEFTCYDIASGLTYSAAYTDKFSFGLTAKYLREKLDEHAVNGFSVDIGTLYNTGWRNLTIGMALRNFGPDLRYDLDNDGDGSVDEDPFDLLDNDGDGLIDEDREEVPFKIPMNFSLGVAGDIYRDDENSNALIASLQLDSYVDRKETYNLGAEYQLGTFRLRSGYQFEQDAAGFSAGFGWIIPTNFAIIHLDYSYSDLGDLSEDMIKTPHRFSLKFFY
ncbi:MAG: PorV/PorQ family protein, partial [Candidatus Cloacimonadota bacterium]|nr:PorV/PorQ family protein [Candidatus Cloacimonadota bacterium]